MNLNRVARRRRAALRRARRPAIEPYFGEVRTFTVGDRSISAALVTLAGDPDALIPDHDCPYCRAIATLEEYDAAGDLATPELEQRAKDAIALLSCGEGVERIVRTRCPC